MATMQPMCTQIQEYDVCTQYEPTQPESLLGKIAQTLSIAADETPSEMDALGTYVDMDALETLVDPRDDRLPRMSGHVTFQYRNYRVTVETGEPAIIGVVEE